MNSRVFSAVCCLALMAGFASANLLVNGDFTTWSSPTQPAGWTVEDTTKTRVVQSASPVRSLLYAVKFTRLVAGTGNNNGLNQLCVVQPSQTYTLSAWYLDNDPNARGGISISWYQSDTTYISNPGTTYSDTLVTTWQRVARTATSPATAGLARVLLRVYGFSGSLPGGIVYIDDAEFVLGTGIAEPGLPAPAIGARLLVRPNPSPGPVTFALDRAPPGPLRLEIYDVTGCLKTVVHSDALAGQVAWPGTDGSGRPLAPGLYFAVATSHAGQVAVQKLVFER